MENGKTYNRPVAIVIVLKRMKNLSQVIKAKNDNWTDLLVFRLVYGIYACACAIVQLCIGNARWQSQHVLMAMTDNAMCFAIKMCSVRNRLDTVAVLLCIYIHFWSFLMKIRLHFFFGTKAKALVKLHLSKALEQYATLGKHFRCQFAFRHRRDFEAKHFKDISLSFLLHNYSSMQQRINLVHIARFREQCKLWSQKQSMKIEWLQFSSGVLL